MATGITVRPLCALEASDSGATHCATITADALTTTATATAQTLTIVSLKAGDTLSNVFWKLKTTFQDASDAAFNTDTMSVGDTNTGVTKWIAAKEVNENGTEINYFANFVGGAFYTSADSLTVTFNSQTAKALNDLDTGQVELYFHLVRPNRLEKATGAIPITTK
jgi:hypothetical protein